MAKNIKYVDISKWSTRAISLVEQLRKTGKTYILMSKSKELALLTPVKRKKNLER